MQLLSRRQFLASTAAGLVGAAPSLLVPGGQAIAAPATTLRVDTRIIEVGGRPATVFGLTQPDGTPGLITEAGQDFRVRLENRLAEETLVHWHGLTPPWQQDGVPGLSQPPLAAGGTYDYDFPLERPGTNWMHSHLGLQEQALLAAPLIVRDPADRGQDEQEVVVMLHDFSFTPAEKLMARLKKGEGDADDRAAHGMGGMSGMGGMGGHAMSGGMADLDADDINDVEFDAYLANDRTLDDPEVVAVEGNGRVRLRLINAAAATNFTIDLGAVTGELVAVDGLPIRPVSSRRFPIGIAQRLDIRLSVPAGAAVPVLALREGAPERTGIILRPKGGKVAKLAGAGTAPGPVLDLGLEAALTALTPLAPRTADRRVTVDLTGDMERYVWGIAVDGQNGATIPAKPGERIELALVNRTMMAHPMHLHGHHFQVVAIGEQRVAGALRDTILVPAMAKVTLAFDAANPGRWAFHCHQAYHLAAGMMTTVEYAL